MCITRELLIIWELSLSKKRTRPLGALLDQNPKWLVMSNISLYISALIVHKFCWLCCFIRLSSSASHAPLIPPGSSDFTLGCIVPSKALAAFFVDRHACVTLLSMPANCFENNATVYTRAQNMTGIYTKTMRKLLRIELQTSMKRVMDEIKTLKAKLDTIQTVCTYTGYKHRQTGRRHSHWGLMPGKGSRQTDVRFGSSTVN